MKKIIFNAVTITLLSNLFISCSKEKVDENVMAKNNVSSLSVANATSASNRITGNIQYIPANTDPATIYMKNGAFSDRYLFILLGTTVTWINNDNMPHTVTADNESFDSGDIQPGASFSYTFTALGQFSYHCRYHPMKAMVIVGGVK